jgi:broad specificity phosphatase PhoE
MALADSAMVPVPKPMPDSATAPPRSESAPPVAPARSGITTFLLVRHAERDTLFAGADQPLSQTGKLRAYDLARVIKDIPIDAVYTTKWTRTKQTAQPFMQGRRDTAQILEGSDFKAQAAMLKAKHAGQTVLIVGHSDSVPQIIQNMINSPISQLGHLEYDALWVVSIAPDGKGTALKLRYGSGPK